MFRPGYLGRLLVIALCLSGFLFSAVKAQNSASLTITTEISAKDRSALEQQTFYLVNEYRKANQLPVLKWSGDIADVARGHSKDMADSKVGFGHEGFSKRVSLLGTKMVGLMGAGENVLKTDDPNDVAQQAVKIWLNSPHHLANIRGDFNYSGLGIWKDGTGMIYFTQIFVKLQPKALPVTDAAAAPQVVSPYTYLAPPSTR
jgi:uncharacterized protein YkwD